MKKDVGLHDGQQRVRAVVQLPWDMRRIPRGVQTIEMEAPLGTPGSAAQIFDESQNIAFEAE